MHKDRTTYAQEDICPAPCRAAQDRRERGGPDLGRSVRLAFPFAAAHTAHARAASRTAASSPETDIETAQICQAGLIRDPGQRPGPQVGTSLA